MVRCSSRSRFWSVVWEMGIAGYLLTGHMDPTGARGFNPWFTGLSAGV